MGAALRLAADELEKRRKMYRQSGISSYKPWVILMTDEDPNDVWQEAVEEMRRKGEQNKIQYIGIEIGDKADHATMCRIMPENPGPVKLKGLSFKQFFHWLTDSLKSVSSSAVSDEDNANFPDIES